jgi:hypothetical protein
MKYPLQVAKIISFSAYDKKATRITFQSKEEHEEFIRSMPSNVHLLEKDDRLSLTVFDAAIEKALRVPESPIFEGTYKAFDELMAEADALIARRKEPVLQEHFEQLGLDLGLMDKPNED